MSIDKQTFIRLEPRRFIPNTKITPIGGNQYTTTFVPTEPSGVYRTNGTLTPTSLPFTWNETTGTVTFTSTSSTSNTIFIDYKLYFCTTRYHYIDENPVTSSGGIKEWEPRLNRNEAFSQDVTDMLSGVLNTSSSSFSLLNNDGGLNKYVTKYDNYKNRKAYSYAKIGSTYKHLYNGIVTKIIVGEKISFTVKAPNKLFNYDATLGNERRFTIYSSSDYPSLNKAFENQPIPYSYGALSRLPSTEVRPFGNITVASPVDESDLIQMVPINNNTWILGVIDNPWSNTSAPVEKASVTFLQTDTFSTGTFDKYSISSAYIKYYIQGSYVRAWDTGGTLRQNGAAIIYIDYANNHFWIRNEVTKLGTIAIDAADIWSKRPSDDTLAPDELEGVLPVDGRASVGSQLIFTPTGSGQYLVSYYRSNVSNGFSSRSLFCNMKSKPISQSAYIQKYVQSTGESTNATFFSQAQTQANTNVMNTVNTGDEIDSVLKAIQDIVAINNGILFFDHAADEYKYRIINQNLSSIDWEIDDSDILEPNIVPKIDYNDSLTGIVMKHYDKKDNIQYIPNSSASRSSTFTVTFNQETQSKTYKHHLEEITPVIDQKMTLYSGYHTYYEFSLKADNYFDVNIGQIIRINNLEDKILNNETYIDVLVLGITKSSETVRLKTYDYKKIP